MRLYNLDRDVRRGRIDEVLNLVDLRDKADVLVEKSSGNSSDWEPISSI